MDITDRKDPRPFSWVKLDPNMPGDMYKNYQDLFQKSERLLYMQEIANMPGHAVIFDPDKKKYFCGMHIENFIELTQEEL